MIRIDLPHEIFIERGTRLATTGDATVTAFRYPNGIEALRVTCPRLELVVLPYRGQQVWQAWVDGAPIGMRGMTDEPRVGATLLEAFGAFVYHCGLLGIAAPGPEDDHPLHGELPLAPMDETWLEVTEEVGRTRLRICGAWEYARAFRAHYLWTPSVEVLSDATTFAIRAEVRNLMGSPFPFSYLMHPNFRPVDGARLAYSAPYTAEAVRVRTEVPVHLGDKPGYREQLEAFRLDPSAHHVLTPGLAFDPEVVFLIDYLTDEDGFAHTLQLLPDGRADWIAHRPSDCPVAVRWLSRTPEQDCIALAEPATSGIGGFTEERRLGHVPVLPPSATWATEARIGQLNIDEAARVSAEIDRISGRT
jgi:hypothetical protein